ncbi:MAG: hypothetical protein AB7U82_11830 [Blastocatellales bacterium]
MRISSLTTTFEQGVYCVSADVEGVPLWFESADVALSPSPEAFASAMLIPAIARGETLTLDESLSPVWLSNVSRILPIFRDWWDYPEIPPQPAYAKFESATRQAATALCFSGGADSFHTLLCSGHTIHYLVFVIGFDIALDDRVRFEAFEQSLRAVTAATGARPIVIRTNLREHPAFSPVSWERTHGGALAAIGHLLSDAAGQLLVSASQHHSQTTPWGSHWLTDLFWSSEKLQIVTAGAELERIEKIRQIAGELLAREHLRVCWENREPSGNCSRCEKCVRTRLALLDCGELASFPGFDGEESLIRDINAIPAIDRIRMAHRRLAASERLAPEIRFALQRLIERSGPGGNFIHRWTKRIWSWIGG